MATFCIRQDKDIDQWVCWPVGSAHSCYKSLQQIIKGHFRLGTYASPEEAQGYISRVKTSKEVIYELKATANGIQMTLHVALET